MINLKNYLTRKPLIAILRGIEPKEVIAVTAALINKGFNIVEIPLNSPQPFESIKLLTQQFGDRILIGAGTVVELPLVQAVAEVGAKLIVMPNANEKIVRATKSLGLISIPGVATPTEAFSMIEAGADALKLFPAEALTPETLKALKAVLPPETPVIPVGGITPEKIFNYVKAGALGFGLGSALFKPGDSCAEVEKKADDFNQALALL